ncbi:MAG: undecaprenyl diphosphate synthase family protein [Weeksellaceae bacterium]
MSNFLLWQSAYTEFFFTEAYWPDVDRAVLDQALRMVNKMKILPFTHAVPMVYPKCMHTG